jgi:hypothetical protein
MARLSKLLIICFLLDIMIFWGFPGVIAQPFDDSVAYTMGTAFGINMPTNITNMTITEQIGNTTDSNTTIDELTGIEQLHIPAATTFFSLLQGLAVVYHFIKTIIGFLFAPIVILALIPNIPYQIQLLLGVPLCILYLTAIIGLITGRDL